jgi:hypothetical protein
MVGVRSVNVNVPVHHPVAEAIEGAMVGKKLRPTLGLT